MSKPEEKTLDEVKFPPELEQRILDNLTKMFDPEWQAEHKRLGFYSPIADLFELLKEDTE